MAVKTITIDMEAYEALSRHKRKGDSFSRVIKEHFGRNRTGRDFATLLKTVHLAEDTLAEAEKLARERADSSIFTIHPQSGRKHGQGRGVHADAGVGACLERSCPRGARSSRRRVERRRART